MNLLRREFKLIPVKNIEKVFEEHQTLLKAYEVLDDQQANYQPGKSPFVLIKKARLCGNQEYRTTIELQAAWKNRDIRECKLLCASANDFAFPWVRLLETLADSGQPNVVSSWNQNKLKSLTCKEHNRTTRWANASAASATAL